MNIEIGIYPDQIGLCVRILERLRIPVMVREANDHYGVIFAHGDPQVVARALAGRAVYVRVQERADEE